MTGTMSSYCNEDIASPQLMGPMHDDDDDDDELSYNNIMTREK